MLKNIVNQDRCILIDLARQSINYALSNNLNKLTISLKKYSQTLQQQQACFVTLEKHKQLRGCIGTLTARNSLVQEVVDSAFAAAFADHRFPKVSLTEMPDLKIHISVLTTPELMNFSSEADLLSQIKPGIDGLILRVGNLSGTFLPSVWEQIPNRQDFLKHLKNKAGLAIDYWSNKVEMFRYTTEMFGEEL